jgi:hypothetical protein
MFESKLQDYEKSILPYSLEFLVRINKEQRESCCGADR